MHSGEKSPRRRNRRHSQRQASGVAPQSVVSRAASSSKAGTAWASLRLDVRKTWSTRLNSQQSKRWCCCLLSVTGSRWTSERSGWGCWPPWTLPETLKVSCERRIPRTDHVTRTGPAFDWSRGDFVNRLVRRDSRNFNNWYLHSATWSDRNRTDNNSWCGSNKLFLADADGKVTHSHH